MVELRPIALAAILSAIFPMSAEAMQDAQSACEDGAVSCTQGDRVIYLPEFFSQYNPVTALDMVQRVPGFTIDAGDNVRGFGAAGGNVLINGQRPSTKSADIVQLLSRIGAGNVARIELIRGGTGSLDVGGQSVVVNVVRKTEDGSGSSSPWEFSLVKRRPGGGIRPQGEISYSGEAGKLKYTIGANGYSTALVYGGEEQITRYFGDDEFRVRTGRFTNQGAGANGSLERRFDNGDVARLNVEGSFEKFVETTTETRFPLMGGPNVAIFPFPLEFYSYEVGGDYEHKFTEHFDVKLIGLFKREFENYEAGFEYLPAMGDPDQSLFISDQDIGETIGRLEFGLTSWDKHKIQFGGEVAHNFIESQAEFFADNGMGMLEPVVIDGANTRVTEIRGEPFINDSWTVNSKLTVDIGMAVEFSRIAQSGDADNSRFFTYPKPSLTFTYNLTPKTQLRLTGKREVNQLSFGEFVSSVNFDDEDVDFGNPELQPQRSWIFETAVERRFGEIGVFEITGFYHYVNDVEDLLPIGGIVEVPGNIGDGKRWGGEASLTIPLDAIWLKNARFEASGRWQDSSVVDPVTGADRRFSFDSPYEYSFDYRQDFPALKFSWGGKFRKYGPEKGFGLDEITTFTYDPEVDVFVETTIIKGVKVRLAANDILNVNVARDRTVYGGSRAVASPIFREVRSNQNGGGVTLTLSGTF